MPTEWFRANGDIPGLDYEAPVPIDRKSLKGHDLTATTKTRDRYDGTSGRNVRVELSRGGMDVGLPGPFHRVQRSGSVSYH